MSEVVLTLDGLTKTYNAGTPGEVQVLSGADLTIARGEMVALVRPRGRASRRFCIWRGCWTRRMRGV